MHYAPYIAQVCGFALGFASSKTTNSCNIWAHNALLCIQYPILVCRTLRELAIENEEPGKGNYRMESTIILLPLKPVQGCIWEGGRAPPLGLHRPTDLKY